MFDSYFGRVVICVKSSNWNWKIKKYSIFKSNAKCNQIDFLLHTMQIEKRVRYTFCLTFVSIVGRLLLSPFRRNQCINDRRCVCHLGLCARMATLHFSISEKTIYRFFLNTVQCSYERTLDWASHTTQVNLNLHIFVSTSLNCFSFLQWFQVLIMELVRNQSIILRLRLLIFPVYRLRFKQSTSFKSIRIVGIK